MAAVMSGAMEFGFVPSETVSALHDLGNWKVRADAIERLSACVSDLAPGGRAALPRINDFVAFLNKLLGDPNFKISLTTLQIWETLLEKLGKQARPAVEVVVPTLVKKLGDSKSVVKEANMRALNSLYRVLPEDTVHAIFSVYDGGGKFSRERSIPREGPALARLKEDAICALMRAMLNADRFPHPDVSNAEIVSRLVAAASANEQGKGFDDSKTDLKRARATAVEAIALVHASLGKDETWRLVDNAKNGQGRKECGANLRWQLTTRFEDARVARLSREGLIEHCAAAPPPLAAGVKDDPGSTQVKVLLRLLLRRRRIHQDRERRVVPQPYQAKTRRAVPQRLARPRTRLESVVFVAGGSLVAALEELRVELASGRRGRRRDARRVHAVARPLGRVLVGGVVGRFERTERSVVPSVVQERRGERAGQESRGGEGKGGGGGGGEAAARPSADRGRRSRRPARAASRRRRRSPVRSRSGPRGWTTFTRAPRRCGPSRRQSPAAAPSPPRRIRRIRRARAAR